MTNSKDFRRSLQSPMNARRDSSTDTELLFLAAARIRICDTYECKFPPKSAWARMAMQGSDSDVKDVVIGNQIVFINVHF